MACFCLITDPDTGRKAFLFYQGTLRHRELFPKTPEFLKRHVIDAIKFERNSPFTQFANSNYKVISSIPKNVRETNFNI